MNGPADAAALLAYYRDIGVDEAVADRPGSWAEHVPPAPARRAAPSPRSAAPQPARSAPSAGPEMPPARPAERSPAAPAAPLSATAPTAAGLGGEAAVADARRIAAEATTLAELDAAIRAFDGCPLKLTATNTVFADGHPDAPVMVIGEAPGGEEDRQGKPFVGPAGQLLDRMLASIGLSRAGSAYITNILNWRPPGNRQPNAGEIATCLPFIERHIALKRPAVVILAGGTSAKALLNTTDGIMRLRGRWRELEVVGLAEPVPAMALFHPAYLLRQPAAKREAWRDLLAVHKRLAQLDLVPDRHKPEMPRDSGA
ncbi:MAG: uracil-DNA glycosylase [Rhodospirillaceae bacterium]|nr:uracil-DNA glycosylase [Rhodospirillaceae bacterium]